jgi:D-erythrose 4-phosphate dehydrogenase
LSLCLGVSVVNGSFDIVTKPLRIAINGYGRIGRCFLRALHESPCREHLQVVAINEPAALESIAYLTRFDSTHGRFPSSVELQGQQLIIDGRPSPSATRRRRKPSTGKNWARSIWSSNVPATTAPAATRPLHRRRLPAPAAVAPGQQRRRCRRDNRLRHQPRNTDWRRARWYPTPRAPPTPSCRCSNCCTREIGIEHVLLTTLHSAMNDQPLIDGYHHADLRRTRSAMQSIIPVSTGLARGVERLLPATRRPRAGQGHPRADATTSRPSTWSLTLPAQ